MRRIVEVVRKNSKFILGVLLGLAIAKTGVYAATLIASSSISYDNQSSGLSSTNLQDAVDEAYNNCKYSWAKVGDYVKMTPTSKSYTTDKTYTGYTSTQTINPSELNLWRVISVASDGTVEMVSEYVSSTGIYFQGLSGYKNMVRYLNTLARQYENSNFTVGARIPGYNGQTSYISDTTKFSATQPLTTSTTGTDYDKEFLGGGDTLYQKDTKLIKNALGTLVAKSVSTTSASNYWLASRNYYYGNENTFYWRGRLINTSGNVENWNLYRYESAFGASYARNALRPIVILKTGLNPTGSGTNSNPWVLN